MAVNRIVSHATIVAYHRMIARAHRQIKSFNRFNWSEIENKFRNGLQVPALLLESHDSDIRTNPNQTASFNERTISFLLLEFCKWDDYDGQEAALDRLEKIGLDIGSLLDRDRKDKTHWLYNKYSGKISMVKVGPIFDSMYGWNLVYGITNQEPMCFQEDVWDFSMESEA